jgi:hypothetical protein
MINPQKIEPDRNGTRPFPFKSLTRRQLIPRNGSIASPTRLIAAPRLAGSIRRKRPHIPILNTLA